MTDSDKPVFADCMTALGIAFGVNADPPVVAAYWQFLGDLPLDDFKRAVAQAGRVLKWFPKPAELRELATSGTKQNLIADMAVAWQAVRTAMDRYDYTTSVDFGPLVNAVIRNLGGWQYLCDQSLTDLVWRRKDFERLYEAFQHKTEELSGEPLPGAFGGVPVRVAIAGKVPPKQITSAGRNGVLSIVRELADDKELTE